MWQENTQNSPNDGQNPAQQSFGFDQPSVSQVAESMAPSQAAQQYRVASQQQPVVMAETADIEPKGTNKISRAAKVKVLSAFLVVGLATYIAYWVQEPTQIQSSLFGNTPGQTETPTPAGQQAVSITDFAFSPATINVEKGTKVVWTNNDTVPHTVTSSSFTSGTLNPGETYSYTFTEDGTFNYSCNFHPQMKGKVVAGTGVSKADAVSGLGGGATLNPNPQPMKSTQASTGSFLIGASNTSSATSTGSTTGSSTPSTTTNPATTSSNTSTPAKNTASNSSASASTTKTTTATSGTKAPTSTNATQHGAAVQPISKSVSNILGKQGKIPNSGPEDVLYIAAFAAIFYFNRKRIMKLRFNT